MPRKDLNPAPVPHLYTMEKPQWCKMTRPVERSVFNPLGVKTLTCSGCPLHAIYDSLRMQGPVSTETILSAITSHSDDVSLNITNRRGKEIIEINCRISQGDLLPRDLIKENQRIHDLQRTQTGKIVFEPSSEE